MEIKPQTIRTTNLGLNQTSTTQSKTLTLPFAKSPTGLRPVGSVSAGATSRNATLTASHPPVAWKVLTCRDWTLSWLLQQGTNFRAIPRVGRSTRPIEISGIVEEEGEPLIISGWQEHSEWDS